MAPDSRDVEIKKQYTDNPNAQSEVSQSYSTKLKSCKSVQDEQIYDDDEKNIKIRQIVKYLNDMSYTQSFFQDFSRLSFTKTKPRKVVEREINESGNERRDHNKSISDGKMFRLLKEGIPKIFENVYKYNKSQKEKPDIL
ncbi:PREDICTED: uncharacterized protein LOC105563930 [Vollenhovia emeryi]|uniref:uncharacterized protein LOC105563930 n=1 Tax=Vollenhovia emeryi TaxID=411798 RepID=UPI0005F541B9|nr:PREDICTED: uncharacterized protein LOC105563930 [Vollenhovia emeryi]XP_011871338.1 PREDICTED: uncharacterized protein LOC105563930 [Vollenhovia emeryi]